jgi:hypothetical protein
MMKVYSSCPRFHSGENAHAQDTLYSYQHHQNSPGWVIFLQLARRTALPAQCFILYLFLYIPSLFQEPLTYHPVILKSPQISFNFYPNQKTYDHYHLPTSFGLYSFSQKSTISCSINFSSFSPSWEPAVPTLRKVTPF